MWKYLQSLHIAAIITRERSISCLLNVLRKQYSSSEFKTRLLIKGIADLIKYWYESVTVLDYGSPLLQIVLLLSQYGTITTSTSYRMGRGCIMVYYWKHTGLIIKSEVAPHRRLSVLLWNSRSRCRQPKDARLSYSALHQYRNRRYKIQKWLSFNCKKINHLKRDCTTATKLEKNVSKVSMKQDLHTVYSFRVLFKFRNYFATEISPAKTCSLSAAEI